MSSGARYRHLFTPLRIGPLTVANRIVFSAHLTNYATDGLPTEQHAAYYAARAAGGAGLIITEEHSTHPTDWPYEKLIHGFNPAVVSGYRRITDAVHAYDVPILAQINHNGGQASSMYSRRPVWAPSPVPDPLFREVPKAVEAHEIRQIIDGYATVAGHCMDGGFDGIELQCSHSSIVRGFLSPATNRRQDRYGGPLAHRARLLLEIVDAVRQVIGAERALGVRLCGDELIEGGTDIDDAIEVARMVDATGQVDYINTSIGVATATLYMIEASMQIPPGYAMFIPSAIRDVVGVPVVGVGRFKDPLQADRALRDGLCDLVGVVRGQIADPEFAVKARSGHATDIRTCLSCNQECVGRMGLNRWLGCIENPRAGREATALPFPTRRRSVVVVGGGPGGLQAAVTAAEHGHRVTLFERQDHLGGQVRVAATVPSRAEFLDITRNLIVAARREGVDVRTGQEATVESVVAERPDAVVVATGARPLRPWWAGDHPRVVDVRDVLEGRVHPEGRVVIVDELGFHQATSTAELLADRGCDVEIVTNGMVVAQDLGVTLDMETWNVKAHAKGIAQSTDLVPMGVRDPGGDSADDTASANDRDGTAGADDVAAAGVVLTLQHHPTGTDQQRACDWVVCSVHQRPEDELWRQLRGQSFPVYRVGDCVSPRRAHARGDRRPPSGGGTVSGPAASGPVTSDAVAVVLVRDGRLPAGAHEAVAEAGGSAIVIGSGAEAGATALVGAGPVRWSDTGPGLAPSRLAQLLTPILTTVPLVVLPASPDGRDLAPRLAAELDRPLVARATTTGVSGDVGPDGIRLLRAVVARIDDRVQVDVAVDGPAVVTVVPGGHVPAPTGPAPILQPLDFAAHDADAPGTGSVTDPTPPRDPEVLAVLPPDLHTMDLADATRVFSGGAGLAAGEDDRQATQVFDLLVQVAAAMGGSAGATRVATDAGWTGYERQIGTTGVAIDPDLYVAFGVSGASQHIGGLGTPRHIVSVNIDGSCPMTAMADLGLVTDARELLTELAVRFGIEAPAAVEPGRVGVGAEADELQVDMADPGTERTDGSPGAVEPVAFDAVVVGAGPAGSAAALALARAGRSVALVERGPFPGSKNVYGGVVYGRVLDAILPQWWEEVPVERWVVRRSTMMMTESQSLSIDFRSEHWGQAPFNGMTTLRSRFDSWLAGKATEAGATLIPSTVATGLVRDGAGRVLGVRTDHGGAELRARVVVACDGVNSFLAKEAGLMAPAEASHHTLGVKEVLALPRSVIDERLGVGSHEGVDIEILGCTRGIPGGGFLYTNLDTVSIGVVVSVSHLAEAGVRPEELIADLKEHPSMAPYLKGSTLQEYAAHLIPEGGYDTMPTLSADGLLVAGDAAAMTLAAGIWLEGVNFAIGSGYAAGRAVDRAIASGDCSAAGLSSYRTDLEGQFVLADHKRLRKAPALVLSDRVQQRYPGLLCDLAEGMFTVTNPGAKPGGLRLTRAAAAKHGVKLRELAADTLRGMRIFG